MDEKYKLWQYLMPYNVSKNVMGLARTAAGGRFNLKTIINNIETGSEPQSVYLLDRGRQKKYMLQNGYSIDNTDDYGLVKKAVGNRKLPIYRTSGLSADDTNMNVIGNMYANNFDNWLGTDGAIKHGGSYPTALYYNDKDHYFYQRGWDLNDYGKNKNKEGKGFYSRYGAFNKKAADILDFIGNPMVISTGYRRTPFNIENITLDPNATTYDELQSYIIPGGVDTLQRQFNTWLKKHKGSSMIDPFNIYDINHGGTYEFTDYGDYLNKKENFDNFNRYGYALDNNGNILYDDNGKPKYNYDKPKYNNYTLKKDIHKYMIVNTTKVPEVVAKRKRKSLGGIY